MGAHLTCYASGYWARKLDGQEVVLLDDLHDRKFIQYKDERLEICPYRASKRGNLVFVVGDGLEHMSVAQYGLRNKTKFTIKLKE